MKKALVESKPAATELAPDNVTEKQLTKAQQDLLDVLKDDRVINLDVEQICKLARITRPTYYAAFRDQTFLAALENAVQTMLTAAEPQVVLNIVKKAKDPNTKSHHWALMVEKMKGRLDEKSQKPAQITVNFGNLARPKIAIAPTGHMIIEGETEDDPAV